MFFPGETITHRFILPFGYREIDHVIISYKQNEGVMLEKTAPSASAVIEEEGVSLCSVTYTMSQQECLLFEDNLPFTIQLNVYTTGGTRHTSHELKSSSGIQFYRNVMTAQGEVENNG